MTTAAPARQVFRLPDLGEGLTEAEVLEWKVAVGDAVEVDQVVVEVETAKAAVEVPVPFAGTVLKLHAGPGTVLGVGEPLIEVGPADVQELAVPEPAAAAQYREEEQAGSGNVLIGYGTGGASGARRRRRGRARPTGKAAGEAAAPAAHPLRAPRVISPLVRKIAREHGVDIAAVAPTGPRGVILRRDVEQAIAAATPSQAAPPQPAPEAAPRETAGLADERIPLRGLRRAVADKLTRSRTEIPDATTWVDVDATGLLAVKDALRRTRPDLGIELLALLARICVSGLRRFPELNSSVDTGRAEIVRHGRINLGFAAQTDRGLVVPVVRDAHLMTTEDLAAELARLTGLARAGKLPPEALTGGTFTLNNYGVFGVDGSAPIINHPEAALLGVGRIIDRPWVHDGAVVPRKITQLSLTFDHRVCDGGAAGGFLRYVADCVEDPSVLIAHS
ncbi:dihydrolipoamide acetyltransferase family protein [Actinomadura verrucosospora]|uniref:Dihydrolipoamide acetyltransferase component of pyruvate dehydrogenase complex n=1 Tax=Actinomadura verrucosospora TaxID=46165 RepID=A0A7D4A2L0_ACTVE|nr:dihydrolipoamide acetyltransferase family protein [Actinomadura verrucosospora]QKG26986.1 pyruvate dehydrogenase complex dihydrolipoamide acetyltransferase [Actinomadura verrucosospora]